MNHQMGNCSRPRVFEIQFLLPLRQP